MESENKYKLYKNRLTSILRKCEQQYYQYKLNECKNNMRKTRSILNDVTNRKKTSFFKFQMNSKLMGMLSRMKLILLICLIICLPIFGPL